MNKGNIINKNLERKNINEEKEITKKLNTLTLIYHVETSKKVQIFGYRFVIKNKDKCK